MPTNLAEVVAFTSPVVVPADGDAENAASVIQGFQPLTNRTAYLKSILDNMFLTHCRLIVGNGSSIGAAGSKFQLATGYITGGGFTLASDELTIVNAGQYLAFASLQLGTTLTTDPIQVSARLMLDAGGLSDCFATRFSASAGIQVYASLMSFFTATAGQKLTLISPTINNEYATTESHLIVLRVR